MHITARQLLTCCAIVVACVSADAMQSRRVSGRDFFAGPAGAPSNDGSFSRPWDLATALAHPAAVKPGDTIWIRGGTYRGPYTSTLTGTAAAPIVVRGYPGERVTLDGEGTADSTLTIRGASTWYRDFEVTDRDPVRIVPVAGSHPPNMERGDGISVYGPRTKLINLVVHDAADGIGFWTPATDADVYGCIVYNNGWLAPDRSHGHGLYIQNQQGTKTITDVISFNNFATGMKAYSEGIGLANVKFEGVVAFNNGALGAGTSISRQPNLFVGTTRQAASGIEIRDSVLYYPPDTEIGASLELGYTADANADLTVRRNYVVGGNRSLRAIGWKKATVTDNVFYAATAGAFIQRLVTLQMPSGPGNEYVWDANTYYQGGASPPFILQSRTTTFDGWKQSTGFDGGSAFSVGRPGGVRVFVRPNAYQTGRAHVAVINWEGRPDVPVDLSAIGLQPGDTFEVRDVQDLAGAPALTGRYSGGAVTIAMAPRRPADAIGNVAGVPHTAPQFAAFLIVRTGATAVPR